MAQKLIGCSCFKKNGLILAVIFVKCPQSDCNNSVRLPPVTIVREYRSSPTVNFIEEAHFNLGDYETQLHPKYIGRLVNTSGVCQTCGTIVGPTLDTINYVRKNVIYRARQNQPLSWGVALQPTT